MVSNKTYVTEGLILNHRDFGETDLLVTLFTKSFGKVPVVARRAKMPNSKFSSGVQLLNKVKVSIGRGRNLDHLNECEIIDSFQIIKSNLTLLSKGLFSSELVVNFIQDRTPNIQIFNALEQNLNNLETQKNIDQSMIWFQLQLINVSGVFPEFMVCINCNENLKRKDHVFYSEIGGINCDNCINVNADLNHGVTILEDSLGFLRHIQRVIRSSKPYFFDKYLDDNTLNDLNKFLRIYLTYTAERQMKSIKFLDLVN
tara:strand:+ start:611 stop:1381 length:771 start_codon:yes stop_codon:yes gene_type:complete